VSNDVVARISTIISSKILTSVSAGDINSDTPLLLSGLTLDSVAVLELLMEIENEFSVEFKDTDLTVELFKTVGSLAEAVQEKMARPTA
jgi:acyl carrier protein